MYNFVSLHFITELVNYNYKTLSSIVVHMIVKIILLFKYNNSSILNYSKDGNA